MGRKMPIFYSAMMLTGVNLLLRFAGTSFQVYLSGRIGAAGIGLLQLTLSVGNMAMVAGMGGIRTATMYLTAEELGQKKPQHVAGVLSGCFLYSILFSLTVSLLLFRFAPQIARYWIGDLRTVHALRLFAAFLPCSCLCGVMTGYFTAANRIGTLAAIEVAEQILSMILTLSALSLWGSTDPGKSCMCVVLGSSIGACFTLICLVLLRLRERTAIKTGIPIAKRLCRTALPLAAADDLRTGISTVENLMVPQRLALNRTTADPLAAFGMISGMVFPVLMFPACILFGLAELLIPELARCSAAHSRNRISYLTCRSLKVTLLYGLVFGGLMYLLADALCIRLYQNPEAGIYLRLYSLLIPMLYCDAITDAMIKGLGQQTASVRYNIFTNILDILMLYLLLPRYGMKGYFFSFLVTHIINFSLSILRLIRISGIRFSLRIPFFSIISAIVGVQITSFLSAPLLQTLAFPVIFLCLLTLTQILSREDIAWLKGLLRKK